MLRADTLAQGLLAAVRAQRFDETPDPMNGGQAIRHFPSIDLAVIAFPAGGAPVAANVLFSREHPQGLVAPPCPDFGAQQGIQYLADVQDADGNSVAWRPEADWAELPFAPLFGTGPRFVAPYPASLLKLMLAVGVARWTDLGHGGLDEAHGFEGESRPLRDWLFDMLAVSCNRATSALVAWSHQRGLLGPEPHALHQLLGSLGLPTLRLANTRPDGGWGNAAGAGVGQMQMTAWDSARLMWWLDAEAPPCPWLAPDAWRLSASSHAALMKGLNEQGLDIVLSSGSLAGLGRAQAGIPNGFHPRWLQADGSAQVGEYSFPAAERAAAEVHFAHKIGNTENYSSDAGIVRALEPGKRHYTVALLSNLGSRYAPDEVCASTWRLPQLGAAIDTLMKRHLE
jgi:hypothetical protein